MILWLPNYSNWIHKQSHLVCSCILSFIIVSSYDDITTCQVIYVISHGVV